MKRGLGKFLLSHFTVLILAALVFGGISSRIRTHVVEEMAAYQYLVMNQAMKATDVEIEKIIKKAIDISEDQYVQWFYYIEEPLEPRELFYTLKLVDSLKHFYDDNPLIVDYYIYFAHSGRIANANSFYKVRDFYQLVWSYEDLSFHDWEEQILGRSEQGVYTAHQLMQRDSTRKEMLTYVYPLEKSNAGGESKVVLLLDKEYILNYLKAGISHGTVEVSGALGAPILRYQADDNAPGELPAYGEEGWKIMNVGGESMLVNGTRSENTGWTYTSYLPMRYVMENAAWFNRLLIIGLLLLLLLGSPLCFYWAKRSYGPIQRLLGILFESGFTPEAKGNDMEYLEASLCQVLDKQKDLEAAYQTALQNYSDLEDDVRKSSMWKLFNQHGFCFSAEKRRKLVNYVWTDARLGCGEILNEIYEENHCRQMPIKVVHRLYLYVIDMVLLSLDDSGIDINRLFENQQQLFDGLLAAEEQLPVVTAVGKVMEYISYMVNENKLDSKELVAKRALDYMKGHYQERDFSLSLMAEEMRVSPEHLSRVIKGVTGTNYIETLNQMRLEQAKLYLKTTNMKLEEIAEKVGWGSARYFIRIFKQYEGITPGKYRV